MGNINGERAKDHKRLRRLAHELLMAECDKQPDGRYLQPGARDIGVLPQKGKSAQRDGNPR